MSARPAWAEDFPDPFVLPSEGEYWAFGTNAGGRNVQVLRSADLARWAPAGDALPRLPPWAADGRTWAPVVLDLASAGPVPPGARRYVLYVTVREPNSDRQAIATAMADTPGGPYEPAGAGPLVFQADRGGSIDPSPFVDADGTAYLAWKADANALNQASSLWAQPLTGDGLALTGEPTELLRVDRRWEQPLVEAPALVRDGGRYYLFYSGGWWASAGYAIGYATAAHPLGPWTKVTTDQPWLRADRHVAGPGGQEFFTDAGGQLWMAYHGWAPGAVTYKAGGRRTLRLAQVNFVDGTPQVRPAKRRWWRGLGR